MVQLSPDNSPSLALRLLTARADESRSPPTLHGAQLEKGTIVSVHNEIFPKIRLMRLFRDLLCILVIACFPALRMDPQQGRGLVTTISWQHQAETSITIDDVTHVIDSCHVKETRFSAQSSTSVLPGTCVKLICMPILAARDMAE